jgi:hypothetical protein
MTYTRYGSATLMRGKSTTCRDALPFFRSQTGRSGRRPFKKASPPVSHRLTAHQRGRAIWSVVFSCGRPHPNCLKHRREVRRTGS